jgi:hypothetical protein
MRRLVAGLLAIVTTVCVSLGIVLLVLWLRYGDTSVINPEIIKFSSNAIIAAALFVFFWAWRNPDGFFNIFIKAINLFKPNSLDSLHKRLMYLVFIMGLIVSTLTFFIFVVNDNNAFTRSFNKFFEYVIFGYYSKTYVVFFWFGLVITFIGAICSILYDKTLAKIIVWIKGN